MINPELLVKMLSGAGDDALARTLVSAIIYRDYINQKIKTGPFGPDSVSLSDEEAVAIKNSVDTFVKTCFVKNARKN